jgi:hypothetical protein
MKLTKLKRTSLAYGHPRDLCSQISWFLGSYQISIYILEKKFPIGCLIKEVYHMLIN